jgi:hypothetical protein
MCVSSILVGAEGVVKPKSHMQAQATAFNHGFENGMRTPQGTSRPWRWMRAR